MRDVLVVEDDRVVLRAVAGLCRAEGLRVDETPSAEAALTRLAEATYRLAVVDLMLPEESGFSLLRGLCGSGRAVATLMISGYATIDNALRSFELGAFDFLPKPFDTAELLGALRRGLRWAERRVAPEAAAGAAADRLLFLGRHSWARPGAAGTATLGAAETFSGVAGELQRIELPAVGETVIQGGQLARLEGSGEVHRVWSPLGGLVIASNPRLPGEVGLLDRSPFDAGWLARIVPTDLEGERRGLEERRIGAEPSSGGG